MKMESIVQDQIQKLGAGRRIIHLSDIALKYLNECLIHVKPNKFNLLFYNSENKAGGFFTEGTINSALKRKGAVVRDENGYYIVNEAGKAYFESAA